MTEPEEFELPRVEWKKISREDLNVDYTILLSKTQADRFFHALEAQVQYFEGDLARIKIFGKWQNIPRQQVAYGDKGLSYKFSGNRIPALKWPPAVLELKKLVEDVTSYRYNFVLVNRYRDGKDYVGEHRDDEEEIDQKTPIASLSLGASRDFLLKHRDSRGREKKRKIPIVKQMLDSGSLLMMNYPTNVYWYHSLPKRASCKDVRINLTFRKILA